MVLKRIKSFFKKNVSNAGAFKEVLAQMNHSDVNNIKEGEDTKYFKEMREILQNDVKLYNKDREIRDFLNRTYHVNPYVPKIAKMVTGEENDAQNIDEEQLKAVLPLKSFFPSLDEYRSYLKTNHDLYLDRFSGEPLHGHGYFFQKTLEHFISYREIKNLGAHRVIDIGSAGHTFPLIIKRLNPDVEVYAQDLCFPQGIHKLHDDIFTMGGSAEHIPLEDNTIDYICFHCSIEHFEGDADCRVIQEVERLLRKGGVAVIVPLYLKSRYTIKVNPISGPFTDAQFMENVVVPEQEKGAIIEYATSMVSRFTRYYSPNELKERVLDNLRRSEVSLYGIDFNDEFHREEILPRDILGGSYRNFIPHGKRYFLEIKKIDDEGIS